MLQIVDPVIALITRTLLPSTLELSMDCMTNLSGNYITQQKKMIAEHFRVQAQKTWIIYQVIIPLIKRK
jgi:hypothetical protein